MKQRFFIALTLFSCLSPTAANATADIFCKAADGRSGEIYLNVGRLPILGILSAEVRAFGKTWSTKQGSENKIVVGQAYEDKSILLVDFTDTNVEAIVISLKTVKLSSAKEYGEAGVLKIGEAVYPVVCEGD